jgi:hypothetical protein
VAPFRRRFSGRSSRPVRGTDWCAFNQATVAVINTTTGFKIICDEATLAKYTDPTVVRIRGTLWFAQGYDGSPSGSLTARGSSIGVGIAVMDAQAGALWDPLSAADIANDWMWIEQVAVAVERIPVPQQTSGSTTSNPFIVSPGADSHSLVKVPVDIKAMRKIRRGYDLKLIYRSVSSASPGISFFESYVTGLLRVLIKE